MDPVTTAHAVSREGWQGVARGLFGILGAAFIAWQEHDRTVALWSLGVIALVVSPGLAKAVIAPRLAALLKSETAP